MRLSLIFAATAAVLMLGGCANRSGDQTIAEYCADSNHENTDICKQHRDTEGVRVSLGERIAEVFGVANRAQVTAEEAMGREITCVTRKLNQTRVGTCDPGYTLTSCVQTRYTYSAGGLSIMRSINDTECRFNTRVLEVQVRCCAMGPNPPPATQIATDPTPPEAPPAPTS